MFLPQHLTLPLDRSAQAWPLLPEPALAPIATAVVIPLTVTGVVRLEVVPLPSSPPSLLPQQLIRLLERRAQVKPLPALTAVALVIPLALTGVGLKSIPFLSV